MDESKNGVIILCMGSILTGTSWPKEKLKAFNAAFSQLPHNVIWKWESDTMDSKSKNVKLIKWLPQYELLKHPNTIAFITHGGGLGMTEAVHCGVPILAIPIYGDQPHNAAAAKDSGIGEVLEYDDITAENLLASIKQVLDPKIREKSKKISAIFRDRPMSPVETAVYWVEHVVRHGGAHLRPVSADIPLYRYLLLDVAAFLLVVLLLLIIVARYFIKRFLSKPIQNREKTKKS